MSQHDSVTIRWPRIDDRPLLDIQYGSWGYTALLVVHNLKLFPLLAEKARTLVEVCEALNIAFTDIEMKPTWGYWSIVTGRKP